LRSSFSVRGKALGSKWFLSQSSASTISRIVVKLGNSGHPCCWSIMSIDHVRTERTELLSRKTRRATWSAGQDMLSTRRTFLFGVAGSSYQQFQTCAISLGIIVLSPIYGKDGPPIARFRKHCEFLFMFELDAKHERGDRHDFARTFEL
jgi:hypothetical protein